MAAPGLTGDVLATGAAGLSIAVDSAYVYFSGVDDSISRVPKAGGAVAVVSPNAGAYRGIAVDGGYVYWAFWNAGTAYGGVARAPVTGGARETLVDGLHGPTALALDATDIFCQYFEGVVRIPRTDAGAPQTISDSTYGSMFSAIAVGATDVYWVTTTIDDAGSQTAFDEVVGYDIAQSTEFPFSSVGALSRTANDVAVNATDVYWSASDVVNGVIIRAPIGSMNVIDFVASPPNPRKLALDSKHVFWTDTGSVMAMHLDGTGQAVLSSGDEDPVGIAVDDAYVYWNTADPQSGPARPNSVIRLAKPAW